jgi:hypothetical protein
VAHLITLPLVDFFYQLDFEASFFASSTYKPWVWVTATEREFQGIQICSNNRRCIEIWLAEAIGQPDEKPCNLFARVSLISYNYKLYHLLWKRSILYENYGIRSCYSNIFERRGKKHDYYVSSFLFLSFLRLIDRKHFSIFEYVTAHH